MPIFLQNNAPFSVASQPVRNDDNPKNKRGPLPHDQKPVDRYWDEGQAAAISAGLTKDDPQFLDVKLDGIEGTYRIRYFGNPTPEQKLQVQQEFSRLFKEKIITRQDMQDIWLGVFTEEKGWVEAPLTIRFNEGYFPNNIDKVVYVGGREKPYFTEDQKLQIELFTHCGKTLQNKIAAERIQQRKAEKKEETTNKIEDDTKHNNVLYIPASSFADKVSQGFNRMAADFHGQDLESEFFLSEPAEPHRIKPFSINPFKWLLGR